MKMRKSIYLIFIFCLITASAFAKPFKLDSAHMQIGFSIKHLMIFDVLGRFNKFQGSFDFEPEKGELKNVEVIIETNSIDTNESDRDKHLRSPDFFNTEKFSQMTFKSQKVINSDNKPVEVHGHLTLMGSSKPVVLKVNYKGMGQDLNGNTRLGFEATTKINRKDFGMTWNKKLDKGGMAIGDEVSISIHGEALLVAKK